MDLTLAEGLDDEDILELGRVEDSAQKKRIAKAVDKISEAVQTKAQEGKLANNYVLFAFKFPYLRQATTIPLKYRNEQTMTSILKATLKNLPMWKLPPHKYMHSLVDVNPNGVLFNCPKMPHENINKLISTSTALLSAGSVNL